MGYFDAETAELLEVYILETKQLNGQLSQVLLKAEQDDFFAEDDIHAVFRVMHTIKSSSAMMGLEQMSVMAHRLEDLFGYYREEYGKIEKAEPELFDLLFAASDHIEDELKRMTREDYNPQNARELIDRAVKYLEHAKKEKAEPSESLIKESDVFDGRPGTYVKIMFEPGCKMENVRAFMLVRQIKSLCSDIETYPDNLEKSAEHAQYIENNGLLLRFESTEKDQVLHALEKGLFVFSCEVIPTGERKEEAIPAEKPAGKSNKESTETEFLNVRTDRLDKLQNLSGELMIHMLTLDNALEESGCEEIREGIAHQISRLISEVERTVMETRLVRVSGIVPKLKRVFRDIARDQKKDVELIVNCADMEADKSIVDHLSEALMHIMRNAVDHGIETTAEREKTGKPAKGKVIFNVESIVGELLITVTDDGRGIDEKKIIEKARAANLVDSADEYSYDKVFDLLLKPGFTTKEQVTEYSGRGVGLDVVKSILEDIGGRLHISSEKGKGTTFRITVPLSLATIECARFKVGEYRFSMPARYVYQFVDYSENKNNIQKINGRDYVLYEDRMVPLIDFRKLYDISGEVPEGALYIYVKVAEKEGCILADSMYEQKRIVVKQLPALIGAQYRHSAGISGCSIMGNGRICAALDLELLIKSFDKEISNGKKQQ